MKRSALFAVIVAIAVACFARPSHAETPANRFIASAVAPNEKFEAAALLVERHGDHGKPMILIPGLSSGPWAFNEMVRQFQADHVVYVVTLPGFDGRPAPSGDPIATALEGIDKLVASRKLDKPILVGHSLGATLAIAYAEKHPVGGVVAIDGLPVFPGTENIPLEQRPQVAASMKARMAGMTREMFDAQQRQYMRMVGSVDTGRADDLAQLSSRSDPAAVAAYVGDIMGMDLRKDLHAISAPVLVIAPFFDADAQQMTQQMKVEYYTSLMSGTPKLTVVPVSPSRHFAMIDQPEQVNGAIRSFVGKL
jgi:pimeloyl-ACP methyl ester carboxylesterase